MSKWTKPENEAAIVSAAANNKSIAGMCRELGIAPRGGNIATIRFHISRLNLDVSHHTGQGWNKENYSEPHSTRNNQTIKRRLLRERGHKCWTCGLERWMGQPIPLELEHVDGDNRNNEESNLRILCCNCHAQTPTFRNKKRAGAPELVRESA